MFRNTTMLGMVMLGILVSLAYTPKALGQQVISVRDPQTGRRFVADLSAYPELWQEGQAINTALRQLQNRVNSYNNYADKLKVFERVFDKQKADLAKIQKQMASIPKTVVSSSGDAATGSLNFRSSTNPAWTKVQGEFTVLSGSMRRTEEVLSAFRTQVNLEWYRLKDDTATVSRRLDQWSKQVLALPNVKGQ